ncbi:MAG: hypothetical protein ACM3N7_08335, partial [Planctomycetaceae bacterium]
MTLESGVVCHSGLGPESIILSVCVDSIFPNIPPFHYFSIPNCLLLFFNLFDLPARRIIFFGIDNHM